MTKLDLILKRADIRFWKALAFAALSLIVFIPASVDAAVTVTSFSAKAQATQIVLTWRTVSEVNNAGFNLYRSTSSNGPWTTRINSSLIPAQCPICVVSNKTYNYNDAAVAANQTYYYKLASVDTAGGSQQFGPVSATLAQAAAPTPTASKANTSTPIPLLTSTATNVPDANPTSAASVIPTAISTGIPLSSQTPGTSPVAGSTPSPTNMKVARAVPTTAHDSGSANGIQDVPTPGVTLVAIGIKQSTPEPDTSDPATESSATTGDSSENSTYYLGRLVISGVLLASFLLLMGTLVLGTLAIYFFMRANLQ